MFSEQDMIDRNPNHSIEPAHKLKIPESDPSKIRENSPAAINYWLPTIMALLFVGFIGQFPSHPGILGKPIPGLQFFQVTLALSEGVV